MARNFANTPSEVGDLARAWAIMYKNVVHEGCPRWKQATGPINSLIAMLSELGVKAESLHKWTDSKCNIVLSSLLSSKSDKLDTECYLVDLAEEHLLEKASQHEHCSELKDGICDIFSFGLYRAMRRKSPKRSAMLLAFLADAIWSGERRADAGFNVDNSCLRCGEPIETLEHAIYKCPCNARSNDQLVQDTNGICNHELIRSHPSILYRGIVPTCALPTLSPLVPSKFFTFLRGSIANLESGTAYTDASGGEAGDLPMARRVGLGGVCFVEVDFASPTSGPPGTRLRSSPMGKVGSPFRVGSFGGRDRLASKVCRMTPSPCMAHSMGTTKRSREASLL